LLALMFMRCSNFDETLFKGRKMSNNSSDQRAPRAYIQGAYLNDLGAITLCRPGAERYGFGFVSYVCPVAAALPPTADEAAQAAARVSRYLEERGEGRTDGGDHIHGYSGNSPLKATDLRILLAKLAEVSPSGSTGGNVRTAKS
jgi:hypothetical protein